MIHTIGIDSLIFVYAGRRFVLNKRERELTITKVRIAYQRVFSDLRIEDGIVHLKKGFAFQIFTWRVLPKAFRFHSCTHEKL